MSYTLRRKLVLFFYFGTCTVIFILYRYNVIETPVKVRVHQKLLNFLTGSASHLITDLHNNSILAEELSRIVQTQLANLQNPKNCSVPTLLCGHDWQCGLGCQIHHRIACLMMSYATGMPLIHEMTPKWPFSKLWNETFYPLGSPCTPGPNTRKYNRQMKRVNYATAMNSTGPDFPFPLDDGIVVPEDLADKVESFHSEPFWWWIGQFMKYGLRLLPAEKKMVQDAQDAINFTHPIVGLHIRRTDKIKEVKALSPTEQYFKVANEYYLNLTEQGIHFDVKRVFLASDDQAVLSEAQNMYKSPEWEIIGFNYGKTLNSVQARKGAMDQMVQDLFTLVDCDYVVCTHSSNVCRTIAEMLNMNHLDGLERLKSIDGEYSYFLLGHTIPMKIIKV